MMPPSRWVSGLFLIGILGIAWVVLMPFFHHPKTVSSSRLYSAPSPLLMPLRLAGAATTNPEVLTSQRASSQVLPLHPSSLQDRRIQDWQKHFPGSALPYNITGGGPRPGPPKQRLRGFTLEAQASDAPDPLSQVALRSAAHTPRVCSELLAVTDQPQQKLVSWELVQNSLSVEGGSPSNIGVASAAIGSEGEGRQSANIIQYLDMKHTNQARRVIIHGILRQAEDYEEILTFRTPLIGIGTGSSQSDWQSQVTPCGVKVTLPPQALSREGEPGDNSILLLNFSIDPSQTPVILSLSPLYKKYHQPVLLRVGAMTPFGSAYDYPFSDPEGKMSLYQQPNTIWQYGSNPNILTLVVQQRVYTQEIPFTMAVPVSHLRFISFEPRPRMYHHP